ncbi:MAG: tetratricopeptide repeat protein, partial [Chloroflexi bacterium]|nr:tetratricopeptide repeat protein [Chloroflexota bacterium]
GAFDLGLAAADLSIELGEHTQPRVQAYWVKGVALASLGDQAGAVDSFEQAIEIRPEDRWSALAHRNMGDILESQGKLDEAASHRARQAELESGGE